MTHPPTAAGPTATPAPDGANPSGLDHLVWQALSGPQAHLAAPDSDAQFKRFAPDIAPFAAVQDRDPAGLAAAWARLPAGQPMALVTPEPLAPATGPAWPDGPEPVLCRPQLQMLLPEPARLTLPGPATAQRIETLGLEDTPEVLQLIQATQPGPFGPRTLRMGHYRGVRATPPGPHGLRAEGLGDEAGARRAGDAAHTRAPLVAMAGERLRLPGFTEVSAVCVHPSARGQGLAAGLVSVVAAAILARGETPFLHVLPENVAAIALYQRLGFRLRRRLQLTVFQRG